MMMIRAEYTWNKYCYPKTHSTKQVENSRKAQTKHQIKKEYEQEIEHTNHDTKLKEMMHVQMRSKIGNYIEYICANIVLLSAA